MGNVVSQLLGSLVGTLILYGLVKVVQLSYNEWTSPIRDLPGPKSPSWIWGNFKEIWVSEHSVPQEKWVGQYGMTIKYKGFMGRNRLYTMDPKAIGHVLMNSQDYQKPDEMRQGLSQIVGPGVLVVEGEKHKQQRRVMNPAFGAAQIRELTEVFVDKSVQLRDAWAAEITKQGGIGKIEALGWLSKTTLDIIGLAGFHYHFNNLGESSEPNELNDAFSFLFKANTTMAILPMLRAIIPPLRILPTERDAKSKQAQATMNRIGRDLLRESQAHGLDAQQASGKRRDLLSLLVRANMSKDIPESQRMSDEDVVAQVPTFLAAGHETTSTGTTWALYALCRDQEVQRKLREELLTVPTENPSMDELNALPYLDAVVRETMRVHAPVPSTIRIATRDDVLPLSKPFTDKKGRVQEGISIRKGQTIMIPILAMNRATWIWGDDAAEFRPERWESVPEAATVIPGVWGNMLSFLGGPRACIGYRFSLVEMKALLFTLIRSFEFELAVPVEDITKRSTVVQRPVLKSDPDGHNQLPLLIRPVSQSWM
ncbi:cytochrome P450 [Pluteus cervinus]|uniref:Cytochrome P450 n=1 Tax=Pluteus cervinus TaxID=181527 RepID=A0ACD3A5I3_9AGAR|nr:cytochrome P450 [Pluteus cervinus]